MMLSLPSVIEALKDNPRYIEDAIATPAVAVELENLIVDEMSRLTSDDQQILADALMKVLPRARGEGAMNANGTWLGRLNDLRRKNARVPTYGGTVIPALEAISLARQSELPEIARALLTLLRTKSTERFSAILFAAIIGFRDYLRSL